MYTLLLRLAGPMQSWGTSSKFDIRGTGPEPSKSAVVGLLAAALGRKRGDSIHDLTCLRVGVRTDREGELERDFQIARPDTPGNKSYVTIRYYLADAVFLAGVESPDAAFLEQLERALRNPVFHLYLGRKSYPVTLPLVIGIRNKGLEDALRQEPRLAGSGNMRIVVDAVEDYDTITRDCPLSFGPDRRRYGNRFTKESVLEVRGQVGRVHDAFAELGGDGAPEGCDHDAFMEL